MKGYRLITFLFILPFLLFIISCSNNPTGQVVKNTDEIVKEYNRHVDSIEKDAVELGFKLLEWNTLMKRIKEDENIDSEDLIKDIDTLQQIQLDYKLKANIIKPKIEKAKKFIDENEDVLEKVGYDLFEQRQILDEIHSSINTNTESMEKEIDRLFDIIKTS